MTGQAAQLLTVSPAGWARSQMAFTLAAHIILVPLGVSWAAITLIANYRGVRRQDPDALRLARRWSKYMAVTFAVGAVSGTVLSFEFGLLWPTFMGRFGAAFGIPFAVEGLFFFAEAIFLAIYIYGWDRLRPWPHFWSGVPIMVAGIGGTVSVVAANGWMNEPAGFGLSRAGKVTSVDPFGVFFNKAMPWESVHMVVAAYLVGGFLVASVYAAGMLRGRRDRYHRLGVLIPLTVAAVAAPVQLVVGDTLARFVYQHEPVKFAAMEIVPTTRSDAPEVLLGHLDANGHVSGGLPIPGFASWLSDPGKGTSTVVQGLSTVPEGSRPTIAEVNIVHWCWDVMVGIGTALFLLAVWFALLWWRRRDLPRTSWFYWAVALSGVASVVCMEAGWVVTEVGRQPWIVHDYMKVGQAATTNAHVWVTFTVVTLVYVVVGVGLVLVLRAMSRRFRAEGQPGPSGGPPEGERADAGEPGVPYGPRPGATVG